MTSHQLLPDEHGVEPLEAGGTWLLDLVATVDHLRRGVRPDITVWDAIIVNDGTLEDLGRKVEELLAAASREPLREGSRSNY